MPFSFTGSSNSSQVAVDNDCVIAMEEKGCTHTGSQMKNNNTKKRSRAAASNPISYAEDDSSSDNDRSKSNGNRKPQAPLVLKKHKQSDHNNKFTEKETQPVPAKQTAQATSKKKKKEEEKTPSVAKTKMIKKPTAASSSSLSSAALSSPIVSSKNFSSARTSGNSNGNKSASSNNGASISTSSAAPPPKYEWPSAALYGSECDKGLLIQRLLCRWWYAFTWPDPSSSSTCPPHYDTLDGFPGVYIGTSGEVVGEILDTRDMSKAPSFANFSKKTSAELKRLLLLALTEQKKQLIEAEGAGTATEKDINQLYKWATKVNPAQADKEAATVLKGAGFKF